MRVRRSFGLILVALAALVAAAPPARADAAGAIEAWRKGDREKALAESEAAVSAPDATAFAWDVRAFVLSGSGRKEDALLAYEKAAALDPKDALARANRGSILIALGRPAEALTPLAEALAIDSRYARAQNHRGVALEKLGRLDEARGAYRHALAIDGRDAVAHNNLGALALSRGVEGAAAVHFAKAIELDPSFQAPAVNAALILAGGADAAKGEDQILAAAQKPDASAEVRARAKGIEAGRAAAHKRWDEARTLYTELLDLDPSDGSALNNLGVAEDMLGLSREALLHLDAALARRPEDACVANNVGAVHVHRGDLVAAEEAFRRVVKIDPRFHRGWHNLGVVLAGKGDRAGASDAFRRAASLAPQDASALYNLAILDRDAGRLDAAGERAAYERALALDPSLTEAWLSLGTLLADPRTPANVRDERRAREALRRFLADSFSDDVTGRRQASDWLAWLDSPTRPAAPSR